MTGKYEITIALTVLSFGLPVLYFILTRKAFTPFSFRQLTKCFNLALIVQFILAGLFLALMGYMDKKIYTNGNGTDLTDIIMDTGMTFTIVGAFFYIPGLILLNIVSFINTRLRTK
ncbi:MAG TPA: hypothetical protein VK169_13470 [Saprospiraceae bacterium]|nr:hypothetical protein [Saprospiraceae bacterium]